MGTLEDKLMGEKLHYYCSSSEGEDNDEDNGGTKNSKGATGGGKQPAVNTNELSKDKTYWSGTSTNTGPKGVVQDWRMYKQLEAQKREENEKERIHLMQQLSLTTSTPREDEARKKNEEIDDELAELLSEESLVQFQKQRMQDMLRSCGHLKSFGKVLHLTTSQEFLDAIDNETKHTTVIIHIYDKNIPACGKLNDCLDALAIDYKTNKFCKICSSVAGMSRNFRSKGLPALLVYKGNTLIGNYVRITDDLSDEFFPSDLESFLIENGTIIDKSLYN